MKTLLYIGDEQCLSYEQLRSSFQSVKSINDVYWDLVDYGRSKELSHFLREKGEYQKAEALDLIDDNMEDSLYFSKMAFVILGKEIHVKPDFFNCFSLEALTCSVSTDKLDIKIQLRILLSIKETYQIVAKTSWGTRAISVNPCHVKEGESICPEIIVKKRPGQNVEKVEMLFEEHKIECKDIRCEEDRKTEGEDFKDAEDFWKSNNNVSGSFVDLVHDYVIKMQLKQNEDKKKTQGSVSEVTWGRSDSDDINKVNGHYRWETESYLKKVEKDRKAKEQYEFEKQQNSLKMLEEERKKQEERERNAMIEKWRRKHGK